MRRSRYVYALVHLAIAAVWGIAIARGWSRGEPALAIGGIACMVLYTSIAVHYVRKGRLP